MISLRVPIFFRASRAGVGAAYKIIGDSGFTIRVQHASLHAGLHYIRRPFLLINASASPKTQGLSPSCNFLRQTSGAVRCHNH